MEKQADTILQDFEGNKIIVQNSGNFIDLFLKLKSEQRMRNIGIIAIHDRLLIIKRDLSKHLHYKSQSIGFNYHILAEGKRFDNVLVKIENGDDYTIPKSVILEQGKFIHFQKEGFERQIFLPLNILKNYKTESVI
jgi:hypothetical protein